MKVRKEECWSKIAVESTKVKHCTCLFLFVGKKVKYWNCVTFSLEDRLTRNLLVQVRNYVQTVLQCITRNVQSRGGNSCPNLNTALGEYLFENKPENNCFYQGEVCSILMNFPDIAINVFYSQTLDPTFRDQ